MDSVNSKDAEQNIKTANDKKQQNERLFVDLYYKELYTVIELHISVMMHIEQAREAALEEDRKEYHRIKEEESTHESYQSYNEAIRNALAKHYDTMSAEQIQRMKEFLENLLKQIEALKAHINDLNIKITHLTEKIVVIKQELARQIKEYFTEDNKDIKLRDLSLTINIPDVGQHTFNIDRSLYIHLARSFADKLENNTIKISELKNHAQQTILDHVASNLKDIPDIHKKLSNETVMKNISDIGNQLAAHFIKDASKQVDSSNEHALGNNLIKASEHENELEKLLAQREQAEIKRNRLLSIQQNITTDLQSHRNLDNNTVNLPEIISTYENATLEATTSDKTLEVMITALEKTEAATTAIKDATEDAKEAYDADPATPKVESGIKEIEQRGSKELDELDAGFDFLSDDENENPSLQSQNPSNK